MARRIKEFIEISDYSSLDELIGRLTVLREDLPADAEAEMQLRGDDIFGRKLTISYFREQTAEEAALERRYEFACRGGGYRMRMVA
jgi:hypothetical protein